MCYSAPCFILTISLCFFHVGLCSHTFLTAQDTWRHHERSAMIARRQSRGLESTRSSLQHVRLKWFKWDVRCATRGVVRRHHALIGRTRSRHAIGWAMDSTWTHHGLDIHLTAHLHRGTIAIFIERTTSRSRSSSIRRLAVDAHRDLTASCSTTSMEPLPWWRRRRGCSPAEGEPRKGVKLKTKLSQKRYLSKFWNFKFLDSSSFLYRGIPSSLSRRGKGGGLNGPTTWPRGPITKTHLTDRWSSIIGPASFSRGWENSTPSSWWTKGTRGSHDESGTDRDRQGGPSKDLGWQEPADEG